MIRSVRAAWMLAIVLTWIPAVAGPPDPNGLLSRTFIDVTPGADFENGNYEHRRDRFTNTSTQQPIFIAGIEVMMLNPEDLGFEDLEPFNAPDVEAAAAGAFPGFGFWGTSYWHNPGGIPPLDVPPVGWVFAEFPATTFPVELDPGESFVLETVAHNDLFGPANPPPQRIGELIIGWRFLVSVAQCGDGILDALEDCDDGNQVNDDGCHNDCTSAVCGDGVLDTFLQEQCDDGNTADDDGCRNDCTVPVCGDFVLDPQNGETCDPPGAVSGVHGLSCRGDCTVCGDGVVDSAEDCDDANTEPDDGCRNDCTAPVCGDGILDPGESCDDGNTVDDDGCRNDCSTPRCGDGIVDTYNEEECDDGNTVDDDGCRNDCTVPVCGDFVLDPQNGETCDPPGTAAGVHGLSCRGDCTVCGDGVVDSAEDCDDANAEPDDGCRNDCTAPVCGDGILDPLEDCDDGNQVNDDGCHNDCTSAVCGDGVLDTFLQEQCDDGNTVDDDGCRNNCTIPVCGDDIVDAASGETCDPPGTASGVHGLSCRGDCTVCGDGVIDSVEDCDDANTEPDDGCRNDCTAPVCGDGILDPGESCDDGNTVEDDGCRNDCRVPFCGDGIVDYYNEEECDDGNTVDDDGCRNDCTVPVCGDFILDRQNGETCDPPGVAAGVHGQSCRGDCTVCGDGVVDSGEDCDDANTEPDDGCRNDCTAPVCGDGILDPGESCDDGNTVDTDACTNACTDAVCGDGIAGPGEECDDGNTVDDDGCRNNCTIPVCGDDIVDAASGETCDPPGTASGVHGLSCRGDCTVCGDGVVDSVEDCDDANTEPDDGCRNDCTAPVCGDGILDPGESCDDGNTVDTDACTNACTDAVCGDGIAGPGEECDDGNTVDADACTNACTDAVCGDGITGPGEACDDGNTVDADTCTNACTDAVCGDSITGPGEECDDGNTVDDDGCRNDCSIPRCGDGIVDYYNEEECDDGNQIDDDGCRNDCTLPVCGDFILDPQNGETCDPPGAASGVHGLSCRGDCTVCGDGVVDSTEDCDDANTEPDDGCRNDCTAPFCGDGIVDPLEDCDDGNQINDDGCHNDCTSAVCGDGIVDMFLQEQCDDGNQIDDDGCRNDCTIPICGDSIVDAHRGETCDPPGASAGVHGSSCRGDCTVCGDGVVDPGEDCDDANTEPDDACRNDCTAPVCGDGIVDAANGETCDPPGVPAGLPNECRIDCTACGDGIVDMTSLKGMVATGEDCDDGNNTDGDGCSADCLIECGNGMVDGSEECDDGNTIDDDGCRNDCTIPVCGDSIVDAANGETCDPPGVSAGVHGSSCRGNCTVCGDGVTDPVEDCDDGNSNPGDGCRNDCTIPVCGDGIVDPLEDCDDGNQVNDDLCRNDCTMPVCGDGIVDMFLQEQCDDGNTVDDDNCRNDCTEPVCGDAIIDFQNGETCDPPGSAGGAIGNTCRVDCTVCGDGILDVGEDCDDGNATDHDACRNDCKEPGIVTRNADGVTALEIDDVDGDGDHDVISASANDNKIAWHENIDTTGDGFGDGEVWIEHVVSNQAMGAQAVKVAALGYSPQFATTPQGRQAPATKGGGLVKGPPPLILHLLSASFLDNRIASYENVAGDGLVWAERTIASDVNGATSVWVADVSGDLCVDVLATSATDGRVVWFQDLMCSGLTWSPAKVIDASLLGARGVVSAALNNDSSVDVLAIGFDANLVMAYLNSGGGAAWSPVVVSDTAFGPTSIRTADVDLDGDRDAIVATSGDDSITWYENVNVVGAGIGDGTMWAAHVVSNTVDGASAVAPYDLDFDYDIDIVATAANAGTVIWYENAAGDGTVWIPHTVRRSSPGANAVIVSEVSGDYDEDIVSSSFDNDTVAWSLNVDGLFPGFCGNGELEAFETCDPPGIAAGGNGNLCRDDCTVCGDKIVDAGEDCDDGNGSDLDGCDNACVLLGAGRSQKR